ncbi:MAG: hypothetical protein HGA85_07995 [Nanoarchaeota archaeon]|nr:hypothetical protein [Nanoarchaeota archaeon]
MNSKALVVSLQDVLAVVILVSMMLFWMMVLRSPAKSTAYTIENRVRYLDDADNLMGFLRTPTASGKMIDLIQREDNEAVATELDKMVQGVFGPACWQLKVDGKMFEEIKCKKLSKEELLDSSVLVPFSEDRSMNISLVIPGYRE